jgi:hypothetical protein
MIKVSPTAPMTIEEWRQRVTDSGDGNPLDARIKCPLCHNVATPRQFKDAGADPEKAFVSCIGRVIGAKGSLHSKRRPVPQPCDWTAGGLFGTLNGGIQLLKEDGPTVWVFDFAESDVPA